MELLLDGLLSLSAQGLSSLARGACFINILLDPARGILEELATLLLPVKNFTCQTCPQGCTISLCNLPCHIVVFNNLGVVTSFLAMGKR